MTLNPLRINYLFVTYSGKIFTLLKTQKTLVILGWFCTDFPSEVVIFVSQPSIPSLAETPVWFFFRGHIRMF